MGIERVLFGLCFYDEPTDPQNNSGASGGSGASGDNSGVNELLTQVRQTVREEAQSVVEPVTQRQDQLEQTLSELRQPNSQSNANPNQLFGGSPPNVRQGEDPQTSRGFHFSRLFFAMATGSWEKAKVEAEVHDKLHDVYGGALGEGSMLAPLGGAHLQRMEPETAQFCRDAVRQGVAGADLGEIQRVVQSMPQIQQALSQWDDEAGATFLGEIQQGEMIDLLRPREIFSRAGAREFTLPPNGRVQFPRHTSGTTAYWVGENQAITKSEPQTGMLTMMAKKLAALTTIPNELIRFSTPSIEAFVRGDMADSMSSKVNSSLLQAVGSELEPKGLLNYSIRSITASTTNSDGDTLEPEDIHLAEAEVEEQDIDVTGFTFVSRPKLWAAIRNRRADAVNADDGKGQFIFRTESDPRRGDSLDGRRFIRSSHVPKDRSKGSSNNLTMLLGGVFREFLIGRVGALEFAINTQSDTNFKNDLTSVRGIQHLDGKPRREDAFVMVDQLKSQ